MTTSATTDADTDRLLAAVTTTLRSPVPPEWARAIRRAPRSAFLPDTVWLRDGSGYRLCQREADPARWHAAACGDVAVVTQLVEEDDGLQRPTSSASAPGTVVRLLALAGICDGERVLEIGTGTGWNAGLLAGRLGERLVTSVELDPELAATAVDNLARADLDVHVVCADGADGWAPRAPYDRLLATCSIRTVPPAWLEQVRPGGRIVAPWDSAWCPYGALALTVGPDRTGTGHFVAGGSYMPLRVPASIPASGVDLARDLLRATDSPTETMTRTSPWAVAGRDLTAQAVIGLAVPDVWHSWDTDPEDGVRTRLWIADDDGTSWATVDHDGRQSQMFAVRQHGPRRLWDEIEAAAAWWTSQGRPALDRFGCTASAETSTATVWLDGPHNPLSTAYQGRSSRS